MNVRPLDILYYIALLAADVFILFFISLALMGYDDRADYSTGYYGWKIMTTLERAALIGFYLWVVMNVIIVFIVIRKAYFKIRNYPDKQKTLRSPFK